MGRKKKFIFAQPILRDDEIPVEFDDLIDKPIRPELWQHGQELGGGNFALGVLNPCFQTILRGSILE
jgi:hypothetical protein